MTAWLGICMLLGVGALAVASVTGMAMATNGAAAGHALAWNAAEWAGRPWTLWTSAWVHGSAGSLAGNLLALAALALVGAALRVGTAAAAALFMAWPLGVLGLLWWPGASGVSSYTGLGGPLHAAAMVLWAHVALRPAYKPFSTVLFLAIAFKLLIERAWSQPVVFDPSWGLNVVHAAHLSAALAGAALGLLFVVCSAEQRQPA